MYSAYKNKSTLAPLLQCVLFSILIIYLGACKKQVTFNRNPSVVQVFNAIEKGVTIKADLSGTPPSQYNSALGVFSARGATFKSNEAIQPLAFYALPDTFPESTPIWSGNLELEEGRIYSLFLTGEGKDVVSTFFEDNIPSYKVNDSVTYVRIANMSNDQPVSINIRDLSNGLLSEAISFKEVSGFFELKADRSVSNYVFEVRNASGGALLTSFSATGISDYAFGRNIYLNTAWTLVLVGKQGGTGSDALRMIKITNG